jgi:hypothetical protein
VIVDCHCHLQSGEFPQRVLDDADRLGIDKLVVCSIGDHDYEPTPEKCVLANRETVRVMRAHPDRIIGFCYVNPAFPQALEELETCVREFGMKGLKLWVSVVATDERIFPVVEKAQELGVPILMHSWKKATGNLPFESTPEQVAWLARRYPEVKFIMAHIGGDWQRGIKAAKPASNLLVDTSGTIIECGMIEAAVKELGAERVVFGSDAPGLELAVPFAKVMGAEIGEREKRLVMGENMQRMLGL